MAFLHGVETIVKATSGRPIRTPRTSVVGLVGIAPLVAVAAADRKVNEIIEIRSLRDAERYFGPEKTGYTIPQALRVLFAQGAGLALVVNVFDLAVHKSAVAQAPFVLSALTEKVQLPDGLIMNVVVKDNAGVVTYIENTDYTVDYVNGIITRIVAGAIGSGATIKVNYDKSDTTTVTNNQVIGVAGPPRTGLQLFEEANALFGYRPKVLLAPSYCTQTTVVSALAAMAAKMRGVTFIDAPVGTTVAVAIAGRNPGGAINFFTADPRVIPCYPHVKRKVNNVSTNEGLSTYAAGIVGLVDETEGFWVSPSSHEIKGIVGVERALTGDLGDSLSDANRLNEVGVVTVNSINGARRLWGNRTAAYPGDTAVKTFIPVQRVVDVVHDAMELALSAYLDRPINQALIDAITEDGNAYLRDLTRRGATHEGSHVAYDPAKNPPEEIAAGHLTFDLVLAPPAPAERISVESTVEISLYTFTAPQPA